MADRARAVRVTLTDDGPVLVAGPVEVQMPDGTVVRSDRPVTALCVCRRSRRSPFCDTSHRRKVRTEPAEENRAQHDRAPSR